MSSFLRCFNDSPYITIWLNGFIRTLVLRFIFTTLLKSFFLVCCLPSVYITISYYYLLPPVFQVSGQFTYICLSFTFFFLNLRSIRYKTFLRILITLDPGNYSLYLLPIDLRHNGIQKSLKNKHKIREYEILRIYCIENKLRNMILKPRTMTRLFGLDPELWTLSLPIHLDLEVF